LPELKGYLKAFKPFKTFELILSKIKTLTITNFRNIKQAQLSFSDGLNLIIGDNAAGKTALIEAIWVLSSGRSFRTAKPSHLINSAQTEFTLFAELTQSEQHYKVGMARSIDKSKCKINGEIAPSQAEMASRLPVQLLTPESHRLLEDGPKARRQFLDWGCFHYSSEFIQHWRGYQRALKQRNNALKKHLPQSQTQLWDNQIIELALKIDAIRSSYIQQLTPFVVEFCAALMPEMVETVELGYRAGWPKASESFAKLFAENYSKDAKQGFTQYGCHRADLRFKFAGTEAMLKLSRGQQKLFVCALLLAQASLFELKSNEQVIMLIDDLPAELDEKHRLTLLKLLNGLNIQHIISTTSADLIPNLHPDNASFFIIEEGNLK